ncbi:ScbR family autoregulator-binding transcription factor [Streptomyces sp. NPDC048106]|uniref:ScbR family autoregulator-binding transcription factor n=1 Tax=Streptomyces sp. NPDC048106 TaxID=3155750 RepID=UPI0034525A07
MVKQERAARTRETLMQAAAEAFDRDGYRTTTLSRVSKAAGISIGALTFHFPAKDDLADAVQVRGGSITRDVVGRVTADPERPLHSVVDLTLELARLLEKEALVRAAARLSRERQIGSADWPSTWLPTVERLLRTATERELRPGIDPAAVRALVVHLLTGAEAQLRCTRAARKERESVESQLTAIWHVVLRGIAADGTYPADDIGHGRPQDDPAGRQGL